MNMIGLLLHSVWARVVAYLIGAVVAYLPSSYLVTHGWITMEQAMIYLPQIGTWVVLAGEGFVLWIKQFLVNRIPPEMVTQLKPLMLEAERILGPGTGEEKREYVIKRLIDWYNDKGFDLPLLPHVAEEAMLRRALRVAIDNAMVQFDLWANQFGIPLKKG